MIAGEKSMDQKLENILKRIRKTRKAKQRSIHDCASILNISKKHYLRFESGTAPLTLPDIEVLAQFFDVPFQSFFDHSPFENQSLSKLTGSIRSQYFELRHKMIQAKFNLLKEKAGVTLEDIQQKTGIPQEALLSFDTGKTPIPINNLIKIAECFGKSLEYFSDPEFLFVEGHENKNLSKPKWRPEYPESQSPLTDQNKDPYEQLVHALKQISKEDQARIAKLLLNNLKSQ